VLNLQWEVEPHSHENTIHIHSFSYRLEDGLKTVLPTDYSRWFWVENNRNYKSRDLPPISYRRNSRITIEVELTLNSMPHRDQRVDPLIL